MVVIQESNNVLGIMLLVDLAKCLPECTSRASVSSGCGAPP